MHRSMMPAWPSSLRTEALASRAPSEGMQVALKAVTGPVKLPMGLHVSGDSLLWPSLTG